MIGWLDGWTDGFETVKKKFGEKVSGGWMMMPSTSTQLGRG